MVPVDVVLILAGPFALLWAVWTVTAWFCPPASWIVRKLARYVSRWLRQVGRGLKQILWRAPVRQFGVAVTLWIWLTGLMVVGLISAAGSGQGLAVVGGLPCLLLLVLPWFFLRWWRERMYRPRPLPGRRNLNG